MTKNLFVEGREEILVVYAACQVRKFRMILKSLGRERTMNSINEKIAGESLLTYELQVEYFQLSDLLPDTINPINDSSFA
jgi:hypothetical protein